MTLSDGLSITSIGITIVGGLFVYFESVIKQRERIVRLETQMTVFWKDVSFDAAKILHTPHPENARRDYLLEQFMAQQISSQELRELIVLLKQIIEEKNREFGERTAASNLLRALESQYNV